MRENQNARKPEFVQAEHAILKHMEAIRDIIFDLKMDDHYLSLTVTPEGRIMFNNTYWELPASEKINYGLYEDGETYD